MRLRLMLGCAVVLALAACGEAAQEQPKPVELGPDTARAEVVIATDLSQGDIEGDKFYTSAPPMPDLIKHFPLMAYESLKLKGPVFMGTGGKDADVPPPGQERLFKDACAAGTVIEHKVYPDLDHSGAVNGSLADSTPFVAKAFAGEAIAGNCPK